jgi:hypothetical protein
VTIYAIIGALVLVLIFFVWIAFKNSEGKGRAEAERDRLQTESEVARQANEIDEAIIRLSDDDLDRELRGDGR